jgi:hypothetical protein
MSAPLLRYLVLLALLLHAVAAQAENPFEWGPLPPGWQAQDRSSETARDLPAQGRETLGQRRITLQSYTDGLRSNAAVVVRTDGLAGADDSFASRAAREATLRAQGATVERRSTRLGGLPAEYFAYGQNPAPGSTGWRRPSYYRNWLVQRRDGAPVFVETQRHCRREAGALEPDADCQRLAAELEQVLASLSFGAPMPPELRASILIPGDLKPGDVISPSAQISDDDGRAPSGEIALVWYFNGTQANSVIWDGQPLHIRLEASVDGQPLTTELRLPAYGTAEPVPPRPESPGTTPPGLQGIGDLPGPRDTTEGLVGALGPAALGLLGAMLSGLLNAPNSPQRPPRERKPAKPVRGRRGGQLEPTTETVSPDDEGPRKPAQPERAARARRSAEAAARAQRDADEANQAGRVFTDALGRAGKDIVDSAKTIGDAAKSAGRTLGHTLTGLREVASDRKALEQAVRAGVRGLTDGMRLAGRTAERAVGAAADGLIAAQDAAARVYENPGLLTSALDKAAGALWKQISDPKVLWGALKNFTGLKNFENALDPKRTLLQRIGEVGSGTFKLFGAAQMAASAASAARDAAGRALAGRGAASSAARAGVRAPHTVPPGTLVRPTRPPPAIPRPEAPYIPAGKPPDLRGMPRANVKHVQMVADKYGVQIHVRPTNPEARRLLEAGAHPKPEYLKMKTINREDILLGAPRDGAGKVGYFKPQLPPRGNLSDDAWQRLQARAAQRAKEFDDQAPKVADLLRKGKIRLRPDGTVVHGHTGRPFTGDHDLFDILGIKGERLPAALRERIDYELTKGPFKARHSEHMAWDYSGLRRTLQPGETSSPYDIARGVDEKILGSHAPGGEPLINIRCDQPSQASYYTGGPRA